VRDTQHAPPPEIGTFFTLAARHRNATGTADTTGLERNQQEKNPWPKDSRV
jgi:hypothetical protein